MYLGRGENVETQISQLDRHHDQAVEVIKKYFNPTTNLSGVEIGTNAGDLTRKLLLELPNLSELYTVDPFLHQPGRGYEGENIQDYHDNNKSVAQEKLKDFKDRVVMMAIKSDPAFAILIERQVWIDFVWIDGDHNGDQVFKDIENALKLIRPGGLIGGHDYGLVPAVKKVVDYHFPNGVNTGGDFTWWVYL